MAEQYGKQAMIDYLYYVVDEMGYNHMPDLVDYTLPISPISVENFKLVLEKATEDDLKDFKIIASGNGKVSIWDRDEKVVLSIDGDRMTYTPDRFKFSLVKIEPFNENKFISLLKDLRSSDYTLKYKIPLKLIDEKGCSVWMHNFNPKDFKGIENLLGQWDWLKREPQSDQVENEFDLNYTKIQEGFNDKEVKMSVIFDDGWYSVCFTSIIPINTEIVDMHSYPKKETLKTAIERKFFGMISDGIGENSIGKVVFTRSRNPKNYEVWLGDPIEV